MIKNLEACGCSLKKVCGYHFESLCSSESKEVIERYINDFNYPMIDEISFALTGNNLDIIELLANHRSIKERQILIQNYKCEKYFRACIYLIKIGAILSIVDIDYDVLEYDEDYYIDSVELLKKYYIIK